MAGDPNLTHAAMDEPLLPLEPAQIEACRRLLEAHGALDVAPALGLV